MNRVTIFSNGIADFRRVLTLRSGQPESISLDVKKEHLADVLASLCIYGEVSLREPPGFSPDNSDDVNLSPDPNNVLESLATQLVGAKVVINRPSGAVEGTLMGLHDEAEATGGEKVVRRQLVLLTDGGIHAVPLREIQQFSFPDPAIQQEITKSLRRSVQSIKPDSTQVTLQLETAVDETDAVIQYTVPAAAWKITYRLRETPDQPLHLQGLAVVDNNTEEDWNQVVVSVVTGEPITFGTDLAAAKIPARNWVNVVQDQAIGAVEVERSIAQPRMLRKRRAGSPTSDGDMEMEPAMMMAQAAPMGGSSDFAESAMVSETTAREVGDYSVFESNGPISIGAHRSVIFPIFETALEDSRIVLYYKPDDHAERPFRAFRLNNTADHSLARGVCTVFQEGIYAGSCVIPVTKPGEERLTPFALETGVNVRRKVRPTRSTVVRLLLSEGVCRTSTRRDKRILYTIESSREESLPLLIDHEFQLHQPQTVVRFRQDQGPWQTPADGSVTEITLGVRIEVNLDARGLVEVAVAESILDHSSVELTNDDNLNWLKRNLIATNGPLADHPGLQESLQIQRQIDENSRQVSDVQRQIEALEQRQERLRKNIQVGGQDEQTSQWRHELGQAEQQITQLQDNRLQELYEQGQQLVVQLSIQLSQVSADWQREGTASD